MSESETSTRILKGSTLPELEAYFQELGEPKFRAKQAFRRVNLHLARDLDEFSEFPKALREKLRQLEALPQIELAHSSLDESGTEKVVFHAGRDPRRDQVGQARKIEAVWIVSPTRPGVTTTRGRDGAMDGLATRPGVTMTRGRDGAMDGLATRRTVCISSQSGCTLNCTFCATGTLPFLGNLEAWQIVDQVYELIRRRGERNTNVVFMGMGEPFHNYENVLRAAHILHDPEGLNLGARHLTISTAGVIPSIERFIADREPFNLAISLNHADPEGRAEIMDIDRKYPLKDLLEVVRSFTRLLDRRITFEYVMIPGVNMGLENARKLVKIARTVRCKINLIPLNTNLQGWRRPTPEEQAEFQGHLLENGIRAFNRGSPGRNVDGACGMLALRT